MQTTYTEDRIRVQELMAKLQKVQAEEKQIQTELRAIIYKLESGR